MVDLQLWKAKKKELKLSLQDIANITDISISTLKDILRGATTDPRIETVQRIERALGLDEPAETEQDNELLALLHQMTEEEIIELTNYVDFIISKRK
jgi:transcriptional regulator with XRE-family HTH domain